MTSASESTPTLISWLVFNPSRDVQHGTAPRMWSGHRAAVVARVRDLAPYAAIMILPGGSLMALLLWLYHRQKSPTGPCEAPASGQSSACRVF
jgi:hypothetical protein